MFLKVLGVSKGGMKVNGSKGPIVDFYYVGPIRTFLYLTFGPFEGFGL